MLNYFKVLLYGVYTYKPVYKSLRDLFQKRRENFKQDMVRYVFYGQRSAPFTWGFTLEMSLKNSIFFKLLKVKQMWTFQNTSQRTVATFWITTREHHRTVVKSDSEPSTNEHKMITSRCKLSDLFYHTKIGKATGNKFFRSKFNNPIIL